MIKANIQLPNGTKIIIEGTPEEVAKALTTTFEAETNDILSPTKVGSFQKGDEVEKD